MEGEGLLDTRPKNLTNVLTKDGNQTIVRLEVCRKPIHRFNMATLNALTFGSIKRKMEQLGYDNLYHLYLIIHLSNGKIYRLEKNHRVVVTDLGSYQSKGNCLSLVYPENNKTLNDFILTAEERKISGVYRYSFKDNCQKFLYDLLNSNGINKFNKFILQDTNDLAPSYIKSFVKGVTSVAGIADYIYHGGYSRHPLGGSNKDQHAHLIYNTLLKDAVYPLLGNKVTYSNDLHDVGEQLLGKDFVGVYPSDQIPRLKNKQCCILNLDKSDQSGSHWIGVYKFGKKNLTYDSFGRRSSKIIPTLKNPLDADYDSEQMIEEEDCGARSIAFLLVCKYWSPELAKLI